MAALTKKGLVDKFAKAIENGDNYIGIKVSLQNAPEPEIIINPATNIQSKLEYYQKAYDDSLRLLHCKDIRIIKCASGNNIADIAKALGEK